MSLDDKFKQAEKAAEKLTNQAEKELIKAYRESLKEIRAEVAWPMRSMPWLQGLIMAEMMKYGRLVKLEEAIAKQVSSLTDKKTRTTKKAIKEVFKESYYRVAWALETGRRGIPGLYPTQTGGGGGGYPEPSRPHNLAGTSQGQCQGAQPSDREEITRGIIQGYSYDKTARAVKERLDIGASKAIRIVQTETHRAQSQGTQAAFERAAAKGLVFKRVWVATLDGRTRDRHRTLDGQKVDVDQPFEYGGMTAMFPGGFGIASMDINCRCTVRAEIEGMEPKLRRARDEKTGKNVVISNTSYQEWYNNLK
jgi:SPP1 gp7 family putative phage head morphogenesis protein